MRSVTRLHETSYWTVDWDSRNSLVRFTRSDRHYPTTATIEHETSEIERALDGYRRSRLLVDIRPAPPRNDPDFEAAMTRFRQRLLRGADRAAILVRTAVGALQAKRNVREDNLNVEVFQCEEEALAYLDTYQPNSSSRITVVPPMPVQKPAPRGRSGG